MNTKTIVAVILVTLGIVVLAYSGITFTTPGKPVEFSSDCASRPPSAISSRQPSGPSRSLAGLCCWLSIPSGSKVRNLNRSRHWPPSR